MPRWTIATTLTALTIIALTHDARAHCQVPCGIYHDADRVKMIREDITTITKAVKEIASLSGKRDAQSANQLVRWVMTKEQHAEKIIRTISDYFMAQKIKPPQTNKPADPRDRKALAAYQQMLTRHHAVMVAAMKCKQTASAGAVKALAKTVDAIAGYWKN